MTPPHRRVRIPEYIIQVNTVGANVGAIFIYLYFIDIKQLLKASKWRCCQTKPNTSQSATITQTYEAQIWNHSMRAALRFCLCCHSSKLGTNQWDVKFVWDCRKMGWIYDSLLRGSNSLPNNLIFIPQTQISLASKF